MILVEAELQGPSGSAPLKLVLDTGSWQTLIVPDIMDDLGFNPRDGEVITGVYSAVGKEQGYLIRVPQFSALGFTVTDYPVHVFDLADRYGIDAPRTDLPVPVQRHRALGRRADPHRRDRDLTALTQPTRSA